MPFIIVQLQKARPRKRRLTSGLGTNIFHRFIGFFWMFVGNVDFEIRRAPEGLCAITALNGIAVVHMNHVVFQLAVLKKIFFATWVCIAIMQQVLMLLDIMLSHVRENRFKFLFRRVRHLANVHVAYWAVVFAHVSAIQLLPKNWK